MPAALLEIPRVNESEGVGIGQKFTVSQLLKIFEKE